MTAAILSIALVLSPPPLDVSHEREAQPWQTSTRIALDVASSPTTSSFLMEPWTSFDPPTLSSFAETDNPVWSESPPLPVPDTPPPTPPIPLTLRERALNKLVELGAVPWMIAVFDCIGLKESGWQNLRNHASGDDGVLQINDIHDPQLRAQGLDPYVPEDAAVFAWQLSREGRTFKPWVVHGLCGV